MPEGYENSMFLSIDQSFSCTAFWFRRYTGDLVEHGMVSSKEKLLVGLNGKIHPLDSLCRSRDLSGKLMAFVERVELDYSLDLRDVVIEGLGFASVGNATRDLAILQGIILDRFITRLGAEHAHIIPSTQAKKKGTCDKKKKKVSKDELADAIPEGVFRDIVFSYGKTTGRRDLSDAYWIGEVFLEKFR